MAKQILVLLILLIASCYSQTDTTIFDDNFSFFFPDTSGNSVTVYCQNDSVLTYFGVELSDSGRGTDLDADNNADESGDFTVTASEGKLWKNGTFVIYGGSNDFYTYSGTNLDPGTSDLCIQMIVKTHSNLGSDQVAAMYGGEPPGWKFVTRSGELAVEIRTASLNVQAITSGEGAVSTWYYWWANINRSGDVSLGLADSVVDRADISGSPDETMTTSTKLRIGTYAPNPSVAEWAGGIEMFKITIGDTLTLRELNEDVNLSYLWTSSNGLVTRNNWSWNQYIQTNSNDTLWVTLDAGAEDSFQIDGDSTRYTITTSTNALSSNHLNIATIKSDTITRSLPDTTLPAGYVVRITVDAWLDTLDAVPYAVVDNVSVFGYELNPEISANPTSHDFGNIVVGDSDSVYVKIRNTGVDPLSVTDIDAVDYTQVVYSDSVFTIAVNDSDSTHVWFKPQSVGVKRDTLTITNNDQDEGSFEVPLVATGVSPEISTNPASHDFGSITLNDSDSVYVKIINSGTSTLNVSNITVANASQVSVSATSFAISAADSDSVNVVFTAIATGTLLDTLTIASDDLDEPTFTVPLSANGTAIPVTSTGDQLARFKKYAIRRKFKGW